MRREGGPASPTLPAWLQRAARRTTKRSLLYAWARLLVKICEVDALRCTRRGSKMPVLAIITDPQQVSRILLHLNKTDAAPPGIRPASVS